MRETRFAIDDDEVTKEIATDLLVREAHPDDHPAVREILRRSFAEVAWRLSPGLLADHVPMDLGRRGVLLVAERRRGILGTVTFHPSAVHMAARFPARWSGLRALAVDPLSRRLGVAQQLLEDCAARARRVGSEMLAVHVGPFMTPALAVCEKVGFRRLPRHDVGVRGDPERRLAYGLPLV